MFRLRWRGAVGRFGSRTCRRTLRRHRIRWRQRLWNGLLIDSGHSFTLADGTNPSGTLAIDAGGVLYGTTQSGGDANCGCGTVFSLAPPLNPFVGWTYNVRYAFKGGDDGAIPSPGGVAMDASGSLYGTTKTSGNLNGCFPGCSVVFMLSPPAAPAAAWTETVLTNNSLFSGTGGLAGLVLGAASNGATVVYATSFNDASAAVGYIFSLSAPVSAGAPWVTNTLYQFTNNQRPSGSLAVGYAGVFYGTTSPGHGDVSIEVLFPQVFALAQRIAPRVDRTARG